MSAELFKKMTGANIVHVSFRAFDSLRESMLDGHLDMTFDAITTMAANVRAGKVRARMCAISDHANANGLPIFAARDRASSARSCAFRQCRRCVWARAR
jgi:tripartite-type tricarboxylate transporter receptor subunit TctC